MSQIALVGEVCLDVTLTEPNQENKMRLGGIVHAARVLWAMGIAYEVFYISPEYLSLEIENYLRQFNATSITKIGNILGCPNVILITDVTESGAQGYELLMRDSDLYQCLLDNSTIKALSRSEATDIVIFPGKAWIQSVLETCKNAKAKVHIDIANEFNEITALASLERSFDTVMLSTSSYIFQNSFKGDIKKLAANLVGKYCDNFIFKENRGGVRLFNSDNLEIAINAGAQIGRAVHSVGVGDCFDVAYVAQREKYNQLISLNYASWIASEYASTTYPDILKIGCESVLAFASEEILQLPGVSLPWEARPLCQIYIAAPDFDFVDRSPINYIVECLKYHNFTPRLPVRENGQMEEGATKQRKQELFNADMKLISECQILLAIAINDDPGTLIEIGLANGFGKPVIVYDPYKQAKNLMLTELPLLLSSEPNAVITKVFECAERALNL